MEVFFKNVKLDEETTDSLTLDEVYFSFEGEPFLYTCKDSKGNIYLVIYSEPRLPDAFRSVVPITADTLDRLKLNEIDLISVYRDNGWFYKMHLVDGQDVADKVLTSTMMEYLPEEGVMLREDL